MKILKITLLVFTIIITVALLIFSVISFIDEGLFFGASSAFFFLACTSAFSIYFHYKTANYYPLKQFDKTITELSKKYWALHIAYGIITLFLGVGIFIPTINDGKMVLTIKGILFTFGLSIFGLLTLIETYKLYKFVITYKKRRARQEVIDAIGYVEE